MSKIAHRVPKSTGSRSNGLESTLDLAAKALLWLGIIFAGAWLLYFRTSGIVPACIVFFGGFLTWLIFRALAELLRIQKMIAGIEYSGEISSGAEVIVDSCSLCGMMLHSEARCDSCGAQIVNDAGSTNDKARIVEP